MYALNVIFLFYYFYYFFTGWRSFDIFTQVLHYCGVYSGDNKYSNLLTLLLFYFIFNMKCKQTASTLYLSGKSESTHQYCQLFLFIWEVTHDTIPFLLSFVLQVKSSSAKKVAVLQRAFPKLLLLPHFFSFPS